MNPMAAFLQELHDAAYKHVKDIKFDGSPASKTIMALFATIYEQTESCMILLKAGQIAGIELIQRSNLEAVVHLINLIRDQAYLGVMQANHHTQLASLLDEGVQGNNPYLSTIPRNPKADKVLANARTKLAELKAQGINPMNSFQRFERAGMAGLYRSAYNMMSGSAHQDMGTLIRRHFSEVDGDLHVHLHTLSEKHDHETILDGLCGILNNANIMVHKHFQTEAVPVFDALDQKLAELRTERDSKPFTR